jgi:hypothetical protein
MQELTVLEMASVDGGEDWVQKLIGFFFPVGPGRTM